jgi:hypothetical protein
VTADVDAYLATIASAKRRRDAETMLGIMQRATGQPPVMWGTIVGYGQYHYHYASGREGDSAAAGFAARKTATVVYITDGVEHHAELLERLGPHTTGVSCIYLKDLTAVDVDVLEAIIATSYATLTEGTYTKRAREGPPD